MKKDVNVSTPERSGCREQNILQEHTFKDRGKNLLTSFSATSSCSSVSSMIKSGETQINAAEISNCLQYDGNEFFPPTGKLYLKNSLDKRTGFFYFNYYYRKCINTMEQSQEVLHIIILITYANAFL